LDVLPNTLDDTVLSNTSSTDDMGDLHVNPVITDDTQQSIITSRQKDNRGLLILHQNVNSLQNKFEEIKTLITQDFKSQVVFLTETKIDSTYSNSQFKIDGYNMYRRDRAKGGGGIMAYISSKMMSKKLKLPRNFTTFEPLAIKSVFGNHDVILLLIYRPPKTTGQNYYLQLETDLHDIITWASLQTQFLVISGDLNLDRLKPLSREGKILHDLEDIFNLTCLINKPTRITPNTQTLLDVIITNKPELFKDCGVYDSGISDHFLVYGLMNTSAIQHSSKVISFRSFKNMDEDKFRNDLISAPWHVGEVFDTVDDQYLYWNSLFNDILEQHAPLKSMKVRSNDVPYMTTEWKRAIRKKRRYANRYYKNPTLENLNLKNKWRNCATKLRRKAVKEYWKSKTDNLNSNPREFYKAFKPFIDTKCHGTDSNVINLEINGNVVKDQIQVANHFAKYFSTMADDNNTTNQPTTDQEQLKHHASVQSILTNKRIVNGPKFELQHITEAEVVKALNNLNPRKSMGHDLIPPLALKTASEAIAPSLNGIFNNCIKSRCWPTEWKKGILVPLFKKDNHLSVENYRPITLLSVMDKIFEQLISIRVSSFMEPRFCHSMTAYRKGHSCESTLVALSEDWKKRVDKGETVGVLSTDMSKAFDSVNQSLLLAKLQAYDFSDNTIDLFQSYFSERLCKVRLTSSTFSEWVEITRGCPQGSNLGPLLWNIYQNDLPYLIKNGDIMMYADDHQLYSSAKEVFKVEKTLNDEGISLSDWYNSNQLKANLSKYQVISIGPNANPNNNHNHMNVNMNNITIKQENTMKILGLSIDSNLNYSHHISQVCKRASQRVGILGRLKNLLPVKAKLRIYTSAILPILTYCHLVWHFCSGSDSRKVERVQERALRICFCNKTDTYESLLKKANINSLLNRRLQDICILMYKVKNGLCPSHISNLFDKTSTKYNLRNSDFIIPRFNTIKYGKHTIRYLGPTLWSKLSKELKNSSSINIFKNQIRKMNLSDIIQNNCQNCHLCSS